MKRQYIYTYTGRAQIKCLAIFKDTRIGTIQTAIQQNQWQLKIQTVCSKNFDSWVELSTYGGIIV